MPGPAVKLLPEQTAVNSPAMSRRHRVCPRRTHLRRSSCYHLTCELGKRRTVALTDYGWTHVKAVYKDVG